MAIHLLNVLLVLSVDAMRVNVNYKGRVIPVLVHDHATISILFERINCQSPELLSKQYKLRYQTGLYSENDEQLLSDAGIEDTSCVYVEFQDEEEHNVIVPLNPRNADDDPSGNAGNIVLVMISVALTLIATICV